ncbi:MAG: UDP-N-acetylmuramate--L-alanine ligase, partial [Microcoleus sp. SIO2G3]|nr:UDP-N-acetylmuramate--L-alanine ligase [Microcoleus sp. SIO2G3]
KRKLPVSGSDISLRHVTQRLQEQGAHIFWSQDAANLTYFQSPIDRAIDSTRTKNVVTLSPEPVLPQVVCSTAINPANAEFRAAIELGCPIFHRSDILAALIQQYESIAVAGTHGKTTTSSMIGYLLMQAGLDPTIVVGGEVTAWEGNARIGEGPYLVAEADESDGSLAKLSAAIGVVTNIELDHPDHYTTLDEVVDIFKTFAQRCRLLVGCIDCNTVRHDLQPQISYSLHDKQADYWVDRVVYHSNNTVAQVYERGTLLGSLSLKLLGRHNLSNALAAIAVGRQLGLEFDAIASILETFSGARRRFELRGEYNGIRFIDDYAHHPSEIRATLTAARIQAGLRRVVAVFQSHRYSRTQAFLEEFAQSFDCADLVVATEIYSAGELQLDRVGGEQVAEAIAAHHPQVVFQPTLPAVSAYLMEQLAPGDLVLFLGAGNLNRIIPELTAYFQRLEADSAPEATA